MGSTSVLGRVIWVLCCVLLLGAAAGWGSTQSVVASEVIWCLVDSDYNWEAPPFTDELLILGFDGTIMTRLAQFGVDAGLGGKQPIAVLPDGQSAIVVESLVNRVGRFSPTGDELWSIERSANSVSLGPAGLAYILTDSGLISGESILSVNLADGSILKESQYGGMALAFDETQGAVWVVGDDIKKLSLDLELVWSSDPIDWVALCVDTSPDGSAWIGVAGYESVDLLLHVAPSGQLVQSIELQSRPFSISVDDGDDSVWVATAVGLFKYDALGNLVLSIGDKVTSVLVNQADHSVWYAQYTGVVGHCTAEGVTLDVFQTGRKGDYWISLAGD